MLADNSRLTPSIPRPLGAALALVLLFGLACEDKRAKAPSAAEPKAPTPAAPKAAATVSADKKICTSLRDQFYGLIGEGGACTKDSDCACYRGLTNCGGVTDAKSARRLKTITQLYRFARCPKNTCKPTAGCAAACVSSRCVKTQVGARPAPKKAPVARAQPSPPPRRQDAAATPSARATEAETQRRRQAINERHRRLLAGRANAGPVLVKLYATDW